MMLMIVEQKVNEGDVTGVFRVFPGEITKLERMKKSEWQIVARGSYGLDVRSLLDFRKVGGCQHRSVCGLESWRRGW